MGLGVRTLSLAILVGTSSVARAKSFQTYEPPLEALSVSGEGPGESAHSGERTSAFGPDGHRIRLSLDDSPPPSPRPFRTTLSPTPALQPRTSPVVAPAPASTPPVAEPSALSVRASLPTPGPSDGEFFQSEPVARASTSDSAPRLIRMNLDAGSLGSIERAAPRLGRPIRLELDGMPSLPFAPRPFRSVLE